MTEQAAGVDLHAALESPFTLQPGERALVPTGIALEIPPGYEAQVRPRSGLALRHGIALVNSPGTIDGLSIPVGIANSGSSQPKTVN